MNAVQLLHKIEGDGVELRVVGDSLRVRKHPRLRPDTLAALRRHKAEVIRLLAARHETAVVPSCCRGCEALEIIEGVAGCVVRLPASSFWTEEWLRLPAARKNCWR